MLWLQALAFLPKHKVLKLRERKTLFTQREKNGLPCCATGVPLLRSRSSQYLCCNRIVAIGEVAIEVSAATAIHYLLHDSPQSRIERKEHCKDEADRYRRIESLSLCLQNSSSHGIVDASG